MTVKMVNGLINSNTLITYIMIALFTYADQKHFTIMYLSLETFPGCGFVGGVLTLGVAPEGGGLV